MQALNTFYNVYVTEKKRFIEITNSICDENKTALSLIGNDSNCKILVQYITIVICKQLSITEIARFKPKIRDIEIKFYLRRQIL